MIFIAKDKSDNIIAYSDSKEYLFNYLKNKFNYNDNLEINLYKEYNSEKELDFYIKYEEYQLVPFWNDIILTQWECELCTERFILQQDHISESMYKKIEFVPEEYRSKYLKDSIGLDRYRILINFNYFMNSLGQNKMQDMINNMNLTYEEYELNQQYKLKTNIDK